VRAVVLRLVVTGWWWQLAVAGTDGIGGVCACGWGPHPC
jgi:hypothetical protein